MSEVRHPSSAWDCSEAPSTENNRKVMVGWRERGALDPRDTADAAPHQLDVSSSTDVFNIA